MSLLWFRGKGIIAVTDLVADTCKDSDGLVFLELELRFLFPSYDKDEFELLWIVDDQF